MIRSEIRAAIVDARTRRAYVHGEDRGKRATLYLTPAAATLLEEARPILRSRGESLSSLLRMALADYVERYGGTEE